MINCENCGYEIKSGDVCPVCAHRTVDNFQHSDQYELKALSNDGCINESLYMGI